MYKIVLNFLHPFLCEGWYVVSNMITNYKCIQRILVFRMKLMCMHLPKKKKLCACIQFFCTLCNPTLEMLEEIKRTKMFLLKASDVTGAALTLASDEKDRTIFCLFFLTGFGIDSGWFFLFFPILEPQLNHFPRNHRIKT